MRDALLSLAAVAAMTTSPALAQATPEGLEGFVTVDRLPVPDSALLAAGRETWASTCQNCHGGNKLTGAPKITATEAWAPRIDQGLETLFAHAIEGFIGPKYAEMPARGGNAALSDTEVQAAVAFMIWASGGAVEALAWADSK